MVTVCPSQFATRRTLFHVLVGCGLLMLKVSRLKLPVIWLLVYMWLSFFVPEHGTMFTLALVRFPPTATKEIQYLNAKGASTYTDIAGDPVLYGNLPPREISMKDVFRSGDSSKKFKIAEGQWYRYAPSYV